MAMILFDNSAAPWLISRFPTRWTGDELDAYFASFAAHMERNEPYVHITDLSLTTAMSSAPTRRQAGDFMQREAARSKRLCVAAVQVVADPLMRGALTALGWVAPPVYPQTTVGTLDAALAWLRPRAAAAGLPPPPALSTSTSTP